MSASESTRVLLVSRPDGEPTTENFRLDTVVLEEPSDGEVLLRTIYLSLDPYMRGRMNALRSDAEPAGPDPVMDGVAVCEVVSSRFVGLASGDLVVARLGWQSAGVMAGAELQRLDPGMAPISTALGVLGMPGLTAYAGLLEFGRPQAGETVVVAAAVGPVGATVGQVAKIKGARVVGIAGGPEKTAWLLDAGFDVALDHRSPSFAADLAAACPDGIDVYFENVGGHVWDAVLPLLNDFSRVPVCGLVAHYSESGPASTPDRTAALMRTVLTRRVTMRGFNQNDFGTEIREAFQTDVAQWIRDGRFVYREDIVEGLANAPEAFVGMLKGHNMGKMLVQVAPDPTR